MTYQQQKPAAWWMQPLQVLGMLMMKW